MFAPVFIGTREIIVVYRSIISYSFMKFYKDIEASCSITIPIISCDRLGAAFP